jgi:hypothetical protein
MRSKMFHPDDPEKSSHSAGNGTMPDTTGPARYFFFLKHRQRAQASTDAPIKENGVLELLLALSAGLALIAIGVLVYLRSTASF